MALAALAGVMAAPIFQVNPSMGSNLVIIGFAVVVIGGLGSILGAVVSGFGVGLVEGLTKVFYPQAATTVIFVMMGIVLLLRPAGLFGRAGTGPTVETAPTIPVSPRASGNDDRLLFAGPDCRCRALAPLFVYPAFLMKALCFALFASAFNLLFGYAGLLSFGHAAFFGGGAYAMAVAAKLWHLPPELALLFATAVAALLGTVFGGIAIRRQGVYLAMVTLALSQVVYFYAFQAPFTSGEDGIQAVPRGLLFGVIDLVPRVVHSAGYNRFSFTRASAVVNFQSALTCLRLRVCSQAATSSMRLSCRGCVDRALTLTRQHAELGFGHIESTAVFRGVVPFEALDEATGFGGGEGFVE